ncbi:MAG: prepilin-type N-terminal cleavage/methylation domain-containing protein [Kiritimatiellia bacterium]|jgi:prepilin-type N-terminal cleavage/methylation domain-containing protein
MDPDIKRRGFTLIEMMIVMIVLIVLAGMVYKLVGLVGAKNEEARTKAAIQKVANALEEYRAIYGKYPPVHSYPGLGQPMHYEFANARRLEVEVSPQFADILKKDSEEKNIWTDGGKLFTFGLVSYFLPRYIGHASISPPNFVGGKHDDTYSKDETINQWEEHNIRRSRPNMSEYERKENIDSARKILPFLDGALNANGAVESYGIISGHWNGHRYKDFPLYHNNLLTILDGWGREICFQSNPPHDTYKLWSKGPDGKSGTTDDIILTSE